MTPEQYERKKKIILLVLLVLTEKARKVSKSGNLSQVIETAVDLVIWFKEYARLLRKRPFLIAGTFHAGEEVVIPNYLKK